MEKIERADVLLSFLRQEAAAEKIFQLMKALDVYGIAELYGRSQIWQNTRERFAGILIKF